MLEERRNCTLGVGGIWRKRSEGAKRGPYEELLDITIKQAAILHWQLVCSTTERMQRVQTIWSMGAVCPPITC